MLPNLGLATDSFYKFITTLSLIASVYFWSFPVLYLAPYNKLTSETNIERAKLAAEIGYFAGCVSDLSKGLPDSILDDNLQYYYYSKAGSSDTLKYFRSEGIVQDFKQKVDSLNIASKKLAESKFRFKALDDSQRVYGRDLTRTEIISILFGSLSIIIFLLSVGKWYKHKKVIDK